MDNETLQIIKDRLKELNMSYRELADRLGVSSGAVGMWMNGTHNPTFDNFYSMLMELGLEIKVVREVK